MRKYGLSTIGRKNSLEGCDDTHQVIETIWSIVPEEAKSFVPSNHDLDVSAIKK